MVSQLGKGVKWCGEVVVDRKNDGVVLLVAEVMAVVVGYREVVLHLEVREDYEVVPPLEGMEYHVVVQPLEVMEGEEVVPHLELEEMEN